MSMVCACNSAFMGAGLVAFDLALDGANASVGIAQFGWLFVDMGTGWGSDLVSAGPEDPRLTRRAS